MPRQAQSVTGADADASHMATKPIAHVLAVLGVLITSAVTDVSDFGPKEAWYVVTLPTIDYRISRGPAKSGSREPFDETMH